MTPESFSRFPAQQEGSSEPVVADHHVAEVLDKANRRSHTYGVSVHEEPVLISTQK